MVISTKKNSRSTNNRIFQYIQSWESISNPKTVKTLMRQSFKGGPSIINPTVKGGTKHVDRNRI